EPARRDAVCAQCHLSGEARIEKRDRRIADFSPGQLLTEYVSYFIYEDRGSVLKATSHVEKMYASKCKQVSGQRLWCVTCHDPHAVPSAANRSSWYRMKCLGCHEPEVCKRGENCITCHMPKGRVIDGGHGVLTDHSIPRGTHPIAFESAAPWRLVEFLSGDSGAREIGLAYAEVFLKTRDRRQRDEAIRRLEGVPRDAEVAVRLADLYQRIGRHALAEELYRAALAREPSNRIALVNLAGIVASRGRLMDAIVMWRNALKQNPCLNEASINLVTALSALGDRLAAEAVRQARRACGSQ
ncbi:MAG: hypothetical protein ACRD44_19705, partial [Bryobacteraceae bacterium]